jgi:hypothetical protein
VNAMLGTIDAKLVLHGVCESLDEFLIQLQNPILGPISLIDTSECLNPIHYTYPMISIELCGLFEVVFFP